MNAKERIAGRIMDLKKSNFVKLLGIAFVVAIASTGIFYGLFVHKLSSNTGSGKMLVIAARALKQGTVLQPADVKTIPWPTDDLPKGAHSAADQVAGQTVVDAIGPNEPVLDARLANAQNGGDSGVPEGMRAVLVHVTDSTGLLTLLRPGEKVDIQVVKGHGGNETEVRTALEDLKVLGVGPTPEPTSQGQNLPSLTVLANPRQADVLALADSSARVRVTLRNPLDDETAGRSSLTLDTVMRAPAAGTTRKGKPAAGAGDPGDGHK